MSMKKIKYLLAISLILIPYGISGLELLANAQEIGIDTTFLEDDVSESVEQDNEDENSTDIRIPETVFYENDKYTGNSASQNVEIFNLPILPTSLVTNSQRISGSTGVGSAASFLNLANRPLQYDLYAFMMQPGIQLGYNEGDTVTVTYNGNFSPNRFNQFGHPGYNQAWGWSNVYWVGSGSGEVIGGRTSQWDQMLDGINGVGKTSEAIFSNGAVPRSQTYTTRDGTIRAVVSDNNDRTLRIEYTRIRSAPSTNATFSENLWLRSYGVVQTWYNGGARGHDVSGFTSTRQAFWDNGYNLTNVGLLQEPPQIELTLSDRNVHLGLGEYALSPENYVNVANRMNGGSLKYEWVTEPNTSVIGQAVGRVRVTDTLGGYVHSAEIDVLFNVQWGDTIGSTNAYYTSATGFAISLIHNDSRPNLTATLGNGNNPNNWIHDDGGTDYISVDTYTSTGILHPVIGTSVKPFIFRMNGQETITNASSRWNSQYSQQIGYGDVVAYSVRDTSRISNNKWVMRNERQQNENPETDTAYYEITRNGFRQLIMGRIKASENNVINTRTSDEELQENLLSYINIPDTSNILEVRFMSFPNRSIVGTSSATVRVREDLQEGNSIYKVFTIPFTVEASTIKATTSRRNILLGSELQSLDLKQWVDTIQVNNQPIDKNAISVRLIGENISTATTGNRNQQVRVTYEELSTDIQVPITVNWGSTINISGSWTTSNTFRSVGAYTLHPGQGITYVPGQGASSLTGAAFGQMGSEVFSKFELYTGKDTLLLGEATPGFEFEMTGRETPNALEEKFITQNSGCTLLEASVGDVVSSWHILKNGEEHSNSNLTERQWNMLREEEALVDYTNGENTVYYEVQADHFQPLKINQASVTAGTITRHTSDEELDQQISDFIETPEGVSVVGFERYPDRSRLGNTTGTIRVEETLSTGRKVQKDYEVSFEVETPSDIREISQVSNFEFGTIKNDRHAQVLYAQTSEKFPSIELIDTHKTNTFWQLQVSQLTPFQDSNENELIGAALQLQNLHIDGDLKLELADEIVLSKDAQVVASTLGQNNTGIATITFGNIFGDSARETDGVRLTIPKNTIQNNEAYKTKIMWEMVADPTISNSYGGKR